MTTVRLNDEIVSLSRNLRGMLDYGRKQGVCRVQIAPIDTGGLLYVAYYNGATCLTTFADYSVLRGFVQDRSTPGHGRKSLWPEAEITSATLLA